MRTKKVYFLLSILLLLFIILYNFRYEISSKIFSTLGYDIQKTRRYSFLLLESPFKSLLSKARSIIPSSNAYSNKFNLEEVLNNTLEIKLNFLNSDELNLKFENDNYFFNIFESSDKVFFNKKINNLKYSDLLKNKPITKIWTTTMSSKDNSDKSSTKPILIAQATPKICGGKLIYARQDGNIGAVDFRTGKKIWHKKIENARGLRIKGFFCGYEKKLDTHVILYPTGSGVFCLNAMNGSLITSRCRDGRLGGYESRVSPQLINDTVYVATIKPSGIAAYNFLNGKLKWRTDFEIGKFFLEGGSNPWSNFVIDKKNKILFVNTGSPISKYKAGNLDKYKYSGSLIALSLENGKIIWQFQEILGDTGNLDLVGQPILLPKKIKGKEIVVTLSKTGSIYFINRKNGLPVFPIEEKKVNFGKFKFSFKKSTIPQPFFDKDYFNYLSKNYTSNTFAFGYLPPILKIHRVSNAEVFQWPGGTLDKNKNYLILPSNRNKTTETYIDFEPDPPFSLTNNSHIKKCTSCHDSKGKIKVVEKQVIPSLFLTSEIYDHASFKKYLNQNKFHKELYFTDNDLLQVYLIFKNYDQELIKKKKYKIIDLSKHTGDTNEDLYLQSGILGKIIAISLDTGEVIWEVPAGTHIVNENKVLVGSESYGGIASVTGKENQNISFFTGSNDKKVYAIDNENGNYIWSHDLPASGSAIPLIYEDNNERWIFVVATGGRIKGDSSDSLVAFRQKLN